MLQTEKAFEASGSNLTYHVFSFGDAVAHLRITDPEEILTIET